MKISFYPASYYVSQFVPEPKPANEFIPEWYKKIPVIKKENVKIDGEGVSGLNLKACMPFIDAFTTGYIQKTWTEIQISEVDETVKYGFPLGPPIMLHREIVNVPLSPIYYPIEFIWQTVWRARVPKGYSLLITHPLNRLDLPFTTMTGVVDADEFYHTPVGNIPFFIHNSFTGVIPVGTPMFQIIPIKRDVWESIAEPFDEIASEKRDREMRQHLWGAYKNKFRQKKIYR
jgi:hypothetical protein